MGVKQWEVICQKKRLAGLVTFMNYTSFCCVEQTMTVFKAGNFGYLKTVYICVHTTHLASMHGMYRGAILQGT